jgi:hypothetical protein
MLQDIGVRPKDLLGINFAASIQRGIRNYDLLDGEARRGESFNNRSSSNSGENKGISNDEAKEISFLKTSLGEVLGFVYKGEIYLDETKLSPEVPLHEYTHIWD